MITANLSVRHLSSNWDLFKTKSTQIAHRPSSPQLVPAYRQRQIGRMSHNHKYFSLLNSISHSHSNNLLPFFFSPLLNYHVLTNNNTKYSTIDLVKHLENFQTTKRPFLLVTHLRKPLYPVLKTDRITTNNNNSGHQEQQLSWWKSSYRVCIISKWR
jgi:hypothetical protein